MTHHELTLFLFSTAILLLAARVLGELAKAVNQPAILGEILAGILLGPTVLGMIAPNVESFLFPRAGHFPVALQAVTLLAITLFLLVAGMEVDVSTVFRQGHAVAVISLFGMVVPFGVGFACAWLFPRVFGAHVGADRLLFALFLGTALAISALPVIAKTLLDLNILRSDFGSILLSVAVVDDLTGWILFALILGMAGGVSDKPFGIQTTVVIILLLTLFVLTVGRWLVNRALPPIQAYTSWPGGVLGFAIIGGLFVGAFTEWIGIHSIFGAFLFGVALGDSPHLREKTRSILDHFISFIFAPLFFATIGLRVNMIAHFDGVLVVAILVIACVGKLAGCGVASRLAGYSTRESLALAVGMNARGAMIIILALLALDAGLIRERMFVALVIMSLVTSMMAGGLMQTLLRKKKAPRFTAYLPARGFVPLVAARQRLEAIRELVGTLSESSLPPQDALVDAVWQREQLVPTGLGGGIAVPHARIEGIKAPLVAVGISKEGVDFDAPDGEPAHVIFLILTSKESHQAQLEILADIGRTFRNPELVEKAQQAANYVEFLALVRSLGSD